jgi:hypothetical protein
MRPLRRGRAATAIADLALGILGAVLVIAAALWLQCEAFRLYVFAGVALGWMIYVKTLGTIVRFLAERWPQWSKKRTG